MLIAAPQRTMQLIDLHCWRYDSVIALYSHQGQIRMFMVEPDLPRAFEIESVASQQQPNAPSGAKVCKLDYGEIYAADVHSGLNFY